MVSAGFRGVWGGTSGRWGKGGSGRKGGEMTQTLYAHMNKIKIKKMMLKEPILLKLSMLFLRYFILLKLLKNFGGLFHGFCVCV
jgi:hypothetical protein